MKYSVIYSKFKRSYIVVNGQGIAHSFYANLFEARSYSRLLNGFLRLGQPFDKRKKVVV